MEKQVSELIDTIGGERIVGTVDYKGRLLLVTSFNIFEIRENKLYPLHFELVTGRAG